MKKIKTINKENFSAVIFSDEEYCEYVVKFSKDSKSLNGRTTYYTDDLTDAELTAKSEIELMIKRSK